MGRRHRAIEAAKIDLASHLRSPPLVVERQAGIQQRLGGRPIGQTGIEMLETVGFGDPARQRSLSGGGGPVDGDDESHQAALFSTGSIFEPRPAIKHMNSGKLVAIIPASSTVTGCSENKKIGRASGRERVG